MIGPVADDYNPFLTRSVVIHTVRIKMMGQSSLKTIKKGPIYNAGEMETPSILIIRLVRFSSETDKWPIVNLICGIVGVLK